MLDGDDLEPLLHVVGQLGQILLVLFGNENGLDPAAQRREQLLFQAPDGRGVAPQRDLAGHGDVLADRQPGEHRDDRRHHRKTGRGAILGRRAIGHVHVDVPLVEARRLDPDLRRDGAHIGGRGLDALLHHVAEFTGGLHAPLAGQLQRLDVQQVAPHGGVGKPRHNADLALVLGQAVAVLPNAEEIVEVLRRHRDLFGLLLDDLGHRLAGQARDFALEVPHPGLAGVVAHNVGQRFVGERELALLEPVGLDLLAQQVALGDLGLLVLGVARERDDLHPVKQRPRHVVRVRRGDEHHVRKVVLHFEIVIDEGAVLLGVEHFQHCRGRVATEVLPHLVDLVEQDERVRGLGLLQRLDDLARHRADIGPAVTADLGLVAHATQRDADELAPGGLGHRLAERGLTDTRRADETEDRALELLAARLHREILDDAFLDLLEAVVIVIEHVLRPAQILLHARLGAPRDRQHPVEIVAHHGGLGRHGRHVAQLLELGIGLLAGLFRQLRGLDALGQFVDLVLAILAIAEFLLNGLHLLIQVVLALGLLHLALDAGLDLFLDLQNRQLTLHQAIDLLQPLADRQRLQKLLLLLHLDAEMARDEVGQLRRLGGLGDRRERLFGDVLLDLRVALELFTDGAHKRLDGGGIAGHLGHVLGLGLEELLVLEILGDLHAALALDQHLDGAVGQLEQLQHVGQHAGAVDAVAGRVVDRGVDLGGKQDLLVVGHDLLECLHRLLAPHEERHDHVREHDDVAQRQHGIGGIERLLH
ncbi:hypothetical protein R2601_26956 [Salipiger bermudensis HTCC2601]|uniref:NAD-specific glutamate dehydrogenase n=1 Tax=Salipiger bermudensis (strain DSM 26914 / JCM 13377 / KCTC 12554 / HTCC2601) TaxID=314265 RepID=Q0FP76_SALBH|nr:hypothetical protein R2601_26956 [Salipiger bermudensis HTCC2601]